LRTKNFGWWTSVFLAMVVFGLVPVFSKAVTVEVEEDEEDVAATPTDVPPINKPKTDQAKASARDQAPTQAVVSENTSAADMTSLKARVRISDKIGFYYFVKAGFVTRNEAQPHFIGKVAGNFNEQKVFSTPQKTYIELASAKTEVKPGDLLVIFRNEELLNEPRSNLSGFWVQNLAIVKVLGVDKKQCQVEVVQSFYPFMGGDKIRFYDDEIQRWKQAQVKKNLPDHPIKCFVSGGGLDQTRFNQTDWIFLSAGNGKGVVEGQKFQLNEYKETGMFQPVIQTPQGIAQVFYAGEGFSLAQIIFNHVPIEKGFEAVYQP
jgi:hypothetical protein